MQFRRVLLNDGYDMIQWSVYGRLLNRSDAQEKHLARLGMTVTEKQFAGIRLLVGLPLFQKKKVTAEQMLLF